MIHVKPTQEELRAKALQAMDEADKLEAEKMAKLKEIDGTKPPQDESGDKDKKTNDDQSGDKKEKPNLDVKEPPKDQKPPEKNDDVDYKKKFVESTRESQILYARNKKMDEAFTKAMEVGEPTPEELKAKFPDWDDMGDFEQRMAKDNLINEKRFQALGEVTKDFKDFEAWNKQVNDFITNPETLTKYEDLEGKQEEFKLFASKPTRRNLDFEDLVSSFLYSYEATTPKHKDQMFETGSGGDKSKPIVKSDKITLDQARILRESDYNKYREYLKAGKIQQPE